MKIAVIGNGGMAATLVSNFAAQGTPVYAVCGQNALHVGEFAKQNQIGKVYTNVDNLLAADNYDLICIATPNNTHLEIFSKVIATDAVILLEKPAAVSSHEIDQMLELAGSKSDRLIIDHELRFNPYVKSIKEFIANGTLGKIKAIQITTFLHHNAVDSKHMWFDQKEKGGGQVLLMGSHILDLALYLLDFAQVKSGVVLKNQLLSFKNNSQIEIPVTTEQQFSCLLRTETQTDIFLYNTAFSFAYREFEIKIMGDHGLLVFDDQKGLQLSTDPNQAIKTIAVIDELADINIGRSFISKSCKYLVQELLDFVANKGNRHQSFCTLTQARQVVSTFETYDCE
jgi:predicted dehydrogenase